MYKNFIIKFKKITTILWIYTKYQILTKAVLFFMVFPLYHTIIKKLIYSTGRVSISSGDYIGFLFTYQGLAMFLLTLLLLSLLIAMDVNAFIIMSALIIEDRIKMTARHLLFVAVKSCTRLLNTGGIIIMLYTAIVVPLVGFGFGISVTENFKIPNFITDVIYKNNLYLFAYITLISILAILTFIYIFFFNYLIISEETVKMSLLKSYRLMKKHWKSFIKEIFIKNIIWIFIILFVLLATLIICFWGIEKTEDILFIRAYTIFTSLTILEISSYIVIMFIPISCYTITYLFYKFNQLDGNSINLKINIKAEKIENLLEYKMLIRTKLSILVSLVTIFLMNIILSLVLAYNFDFFDYNRNIFIVAHRSGGDLAAENSILGLQKAAKEGVKFAEIDVQRTKDNKYIINHDPTFDRVSGVNKSSNEMTLNEVKKIKIKDLFNKNGKAQDFSTLEEFLDESKGKIGLFIELKGRTADHKMADDVIEMLKKRKMEKEAVILSLDYSLIKYIEDKYPSIDTGYLYFFSIGDTKNIKSDYLIMEEREATEEKIEEIHNEGKKAIVWTVNTRESMKKFLNSSIDGIITDHVLSIKDAIKAEKDRNDFEKILDKIFE